MKRQDPELPGKERLRQEQRERHERVRAQKRQAKRLRRKFQLDYRRDYARSNNWFFDPHLEREQIYLPACCCLHDNPDGVAEALEAMREHGLHARRSLMVHFEQVKQIGPAAALALVAEIYRLRNLRGYHAISGTYPQDPEIHRLLGEMGFYRLLQIIDPNSAPKGDPDPLRPAFLPFLTGNRVDPELVDSFVGVVEKHVFSMNLLARDRLLAAVKEAMSNTLDHAHPVTIAGETMTHRWWLSAWICVARKEVSLLLFDQGVGIPKTLEPTMYEQIQALLGSARGLRTLSAQPTDGEMILAATEIGRSGTGSGGRGRGFGDMKRFIDVCQDGEMRVLSNRGRYHYLKGTESHGDASLSIGGTLVEWRFRHDGLVEVCDE